MLVILSKQKEHVKDKKDYYTLTRLLYKTHFFQVEIWVNIKNWS